MWLGRFRLVALLVLGALALATGIYSGFLAAAGLSAAIGQCPTGNDCYDASLSASFGSLVLLQSIVLLMLVVLAVRRIVHRVSAQ